jgi:prepilin-type N-terminal cleavage/methylation domain-containing protein
MHRRGFSLVELSIVLVILGLLTGGILAGQSLIRASELRAVSTEYQRYAAASQTFRDKYFAIPGDMSNATKFWGTAGTCPGTNATPSTTAATCDGNGDGILQTSITTSNEWFRYWQHLTNAGLVEGSYSGVANNATASEDDALIGTNVPRSKLSQAGWSAVNAGGPFTVASTFYFEGTYGNMFMVGGNTTTSVSNGSIFKPEEVWNIDTKMDDGKPGTGNVVVFEVQASSCHDQAASAAAALVGIANYNLTNSSAVCSMMFRNAF